MRSIVIWLAAPFASLLLAVPVWALEIPWDGSGTPPFGTNSESWQNVENWQPVNAGIVTVHRVPEDGDTARLTNPAADVVRLFGNTAPIDGLTINNGVNLLTNGHLLQVDDGGLAGSAQTAIAGAGTILWVDERTGGGSAFVTDNLFMSGGAQLVLRGGDAIVEGATTLLSGSTIRTAVPTPDAGDIVFGGDVTVVGSDFALDFPRQVTWLSGASISFQQGSMFQIEDGGHTINTGVTVDMVDSTLDVAVLNIQGVMQLRGGSAWESSFVAVDGGVLEIRDSTAVQPLRFFDATEDAQVLTDAALIIDGGLDLLTGADFVAPATSLTLTTNSIFSNTSTVSGAGTSLTVDSLHLRSETSPRDAELFIEQNAFVAVGDLHLASTTSSLMTKGDITVRTNAVVELTNSLRMATQGGSANIVVESGGEITQTGSGATEIGSTSDSVAAIFVRSGGQLTSNHQPFLLDSTGTMFVGGGIARGVATINGPLTAKGRISIQEDDSPGSTDEGGAVNAKAVTTIDGGTVNLSGGFLAATTVSFFNGGTLTFTGGELSVQAYLNDLVNEGGRLVPGNTLAGASPGSTIISGNYAQLPGSSLAIDIGGTAMTTEYDFVDVANNATLGGDLELAVINGFTPDPTDTFTILNADNLLGALTNVINGGRLSTIDGLGSFAVNYGIASAFNPDQIVLSDFQFADDADRDNDGDVDGQDFLLIQRASPALISQWELEYGSNNVQMLSLVAPEPSTWLLGVALIICCCACHRCTI